MDSLRWEGTRAWCAHIALEQSNVARIERTDRLVFLIVVVVLGGWAPGHRAASVAAGGSDEKAPFSIASHPNFFFFFFFFSFLLLSNSGLGEHAAGGIEHGPPQAKARRRLRGAGAEPLLTGGWNGHHRKALKPRSQQTDHLGCLNFSVITSRKDTSIKGRSIFRRRGLLRSGGAGARGLSGDGRNELFPAEW